MQAATAPRTSLVEVAGLVRRFGEVEAVRGIDFRVERGEVLGVLGPNGAGKSTTMQMLAGALAPSAGAIYIDGIDLLSAPLSAKARVGYLPENPPLYRDLSVDEYLTFCARLRGVRDVPGAVARARSRCGLGAVGRRLLGNLSRGYQQRAGIAQALVHEPAIVILDEPTAGLDPLQIREIRTLVRELGDSHCVVLSTHILAEVRTVCDRVIILRGGRIVLDRPLAALDAQAARAHRVTLRSPPGSWPALPGIAALEPLADGRVRLRHDGRDETIAGFVRASVEHDWGLTELAPERDSLEELFVAAMLEPAAAAES